MSYKEPLSREDLDDYLCHNYCTQTDYGRVACTSGPNGPIMCEGRYCNENYEKYLEAVAEGTEANVAEEDTCDICGQVSLPGTLEDIVYPSDGDTKRVCTKCLEEAE